MSYQKSDDGSSEWSTAVATSMDQEKEMFKEKIEHYKIVIRQLEQELNSTRVRREGVETVAKLLMEARQEIALLTKKNKQLESGNQMLQSRLERNNLPTTIETDEHETYVPQTSKQVLDNLARENSRLRGLLRQCTVNPDEIENQRKLLQEKTAQVDKLEAKLQEKQNEVDQLDGALKATGSMKDQHIATYHEMIQKMQRESRTQNVLCNSLGEESTNLRKQLRDLAVTCQQMVIKLDEREKATKQLREPSNIPYIVNQNAANPEIIDSLKDEVRKLRERNREIAEMNQRWQDYHLERESRMKAMEAKNLELESRLVSSPSDSADKMKNDQANTLIIKSRERLEKMKEDLARKDNELTAVKEENRRLNRQLQVQTPGRIDVDKDALIMQIQMHKEDFESERRDREKAQSRLDESDKQIQHLLRENAELRQQLIQAQQQMGLNNPMFTPPTQQPQNLYVHPHVSRTPVENGLTARGVFQGYRIATDSADEIVVRSPPSPSLDQAKVSPQPSRTGKYQDSTVACPKCGKEYLSEQHEKLLEHIGVCCD